MTYFPQLATGSIAQFPIRRRCNRRTVLTESADASTWKLADDDATELEWRLEYRGLSGDEWRSLENLYVTAEGQLRAFVFLDPTSNLILWSTSLVDGSWERDPGLSITGGVADPFGGSTAFVIVNHSQAPQRLMQSVLGPGSYQYCLSVYASGPSADSISLVQRSGTEEAHYEYPLTSQWQRVTLCTRLNTSAEGVQFGVELLPGSTVSVFGIQAEAQPQASAYRPTAGQAGVYPNARFSADSLEVIATDPEQYSCVITVRSRGE